MSQIYKNLKFFKYGMCLILYPTFSSSKSKKKKQCCWSVLWTGSVMIRNIYLTSRIRIRIRNPGSEIIIGDQDQDHKNFTDKDQDPKRPMGRIQIWIQIRNDPLGRIQILDPDPKSENISKGFATLLFKYMSELPKSTIRKYKMKTFNWITMVTGSVADPGCLSRIPDPDFSPSRIPDPGSRISDPGSRIQPKRRR